MIFLKHCHPLPYRVGCTIRSNYVNIQDYRRRESITCFQPTEKHVAFTYSNLAIEFKRSCEISYKKKTNKNDWFHIVKVLNKRVVKFNVRVLRYGEQSDTTVILIVNGAHNRRYIKFST